jgi:hypothetical protein
MDDGDGLKYNCIRYFNVKSESRLVPAPVQMQNKANCAGLTNCQVAGTLIEYDQVKFLQDQIVKRVKLSAHFSAEVPDLNYVRTADGHYMYTPAATSFCTEGLQEYNGTKYMVTLCSVLRDAEL